jgi:Transposase, Mutator family
MRKSGGLASIRYSKALIEARTVALPLGVSGCAGPGSVRCAHRATRVSPSTVSDLNKKIYGTIEAWRNRPIERHTYVYLDDIVLKRSWAGEVRNVSLLVAVGVNSEGYREILGICESAEKDKVGWSALLKHLKERGLNGGRLIISGCRDGLRCAHSAVHCTADPPLHPAARSMSPPRCPGQHGPGGS